MVQFYLPHASIFHRDAAKKQPKDGKGLPVGLRGDADAVTGSPAKRRRTDENESADITDKEDAVDAIFSTGTKFDPRGEEGIFVQRR